MPSDPPTKQPATWWLVTQVIAGAAVGGVLVWHTGGKGALIPVPAFLRVILIYVLVADILWKFSGRAPARWTELRWLAGFLFGVLIFGLVAPLYGADIEWYLDTALGIGSVYLLFYGYPIARTYRSQIGAFGILFYLVLPSVVAALVFVMEWIGHPKPLHHIYRMASLNFTLLCISVFRRYLDTDGRFEHEPEPPARQVITQ